MSILWMRKLKLKELKGLTNQAPQSVQPGTAPGDGLPVPTFPALNSCTRIATLPAPVSGLPDDWNQSSSLCRLAPIRESLPLPATPGPPHPREGGLATAAPFPPRQKSAMKTILQGRGSSYLLSGVVSLLGGRQRIHSSGTLFNQSF